MMKDSYPSQMAFNDDVRAHINALEEVSAYREKRIDALEKKVESLGVFFKTIGYDPEDPAGCGWVDPDQHEGDVPRGTIEAPLSERVAQMVEDAMKDTHDGPAPPDNFVMCSDCDHYVDKKNAIQMPSGEWECKGHHYVPPAHNED